MLGNYLTMALRLLWRERSYAAINIFGLAVGFCLCLLVIQLAAYQLSVGDFHEKKDRVFRVLGPPSWGEGEAQYSGSMRIPLGPTLKEQLPEVEEAVRFSFGWPRLLRVGDEEGIYEEVRGVEAGVFDMFSLPLLRGDPKTALLRPHTLVLTEPLARQLFGESDPIGQVVRVGEEFDCEVTGIVGPLPSSSLLQFSGLLSLTAATEPMMASGWNASAFETFVQLTPGADPAAVAARIPDIVKEARKLPEAAGSYALQLLKAIYFDTEVRSSVSSGGNPMYLVLCAILAVVILTIAGVNYVNLATARAGRRMHEIGVRKALGAHRGQLMRQLLSESVLLSAAATVLGIVMAEVMVVLLPALVGFDFEWSSLRWTSSTYAGAAALAVGVGLIAGAYPAWVVARFQPATIVQGGRMGGARLRRGLVVVQFTVTAALLTMTLLIWHQVDYFQNLLREDSILGAKPEQVVVIKNRSLTVDQARTFKTELLQDSRIATVSLSGGIPGEGMEMVFMAGEDQMMINVYQVDSDFIEIMGLRLLQGRALTDEPADAQAVVINETAARMMGLEEPLGEMINASRGDSRVVGVIEDFHFHGPRSKIEPLVILQVDGGAGVILVRAQPGHLDAALKVIDDQWAAVAPYHPIQRNSLEEVTSKLYSKDLMVGRALTLFLFLAIAVASVGLFGMAAHAAHERTKEIGIRKVFGASPGGLTAMMMRDFAKPVAIAFLFSVPIAYGLATHWLQEFAYRVEIGVGLFLVSGALSFVIAGLTVGYQAMLAALSNPIDTLRTE
ncbi:MAG: FtsX-like permease family protein [Gemmatimonadetes bacterium]|nr:FtsX-like permease family protein [Gemmatimonadota bacterium]MYB71964.1 FtsX-like permease family protein [Gemmatimonadota bacterium]